MKFLSKRVVFVTSIALLTLTLITVEELGFCKLISSSNTCPIPAEDNYESLLLMFTASLFPLSLLTLSLQTKVFTAWSKFALFGIPLVLLFTWWNVNQSAGFMGLGSGFLMGQLVLVYGTYFLISLIVIIRAWRKGRASTNFTQ